MYWFIQNHLSTRLNSFGSIYEWKFEFSLRASAYSGRLGTFNYHLLNFNGDSSSIIIIY